MNEQLVQDYGHHILQVWINVLLLGRLTAEVDRKHSLFVMDSHNKIRDVTAKSMKSELKGVQ